MLRSVWLLGLEALNVGFDLLVTIRSFEESCPMVKNILLLDSEGKRVAVKYYSDDWPTNSAKLAFEKSLFTKTMKSNARTEAEITMFDSNIIIYKFVQDLHFYVTGGEDENELILAAVLQGFFDSVSLLLRSNVEKREALENLDLIFLCLDEIVERGMILETDANVIAGKVAVNSMDPSAPLSEQTIGQALATAREHLTRTLFQTTTYRSLAWGDAKRSFLWRCIFGEIGVCLLLLVVVQQVVLGVWSARASLLKLLLGRGALMMWVQFPTSPLPARGGLAGVMEVSAVVGRC
ncbi:unnamed protein product [Dovyalis caffra]|uniref:Coatomer subunit zeta n=1 Tax=Dovyalis caffra TaxID=77055 RepID=A0AAV1SS70_9ROSI|nr:unnamed protein product [Dovyalis caffra]